MLKACYSSRYFAQTHTNSMEKLTAVAEVLEQQQIADLVDPESIDHKILYSIHDPNYVKAFMTGKKPLATTQGFKNWTPQFREAILSIQAGQLLATSIAFKQGISANIAQGFHHAVYERGNAYCTFNGLALIAKQFPHKKIFVLDCDQHGGNGTAEYTQSITNLYNFSIYALAFGCTSSERSLTRHIHNKKGSFDEYAEAVVEGFEHALDWQADLIIYQAGMDCHQNDRCGSKWFTTEMLYQRDLMVFKLAKKYDIPIMFVLAGGYQKLDDLVPLHVNTFKAANQVYFNS
ncbi:histone deacetylase [Acinetobacter silvestris]|uniref:Histone deacetylase n=1 Tax=Acinetobacter silvestris TaxID=1977882 RepID=A0A1Y3CI26_9GAMM|nr:histone deacetylase [Acinetobacter silvestris]OTG66775.1 histone deacetylase [Acinetobacter silvestris]